jgi:GLPGLI family protein
LEIKANLEISFFINLPFTIMLFNLRNLGLALLLLTGITLNGQSSLSIEYKLKLMESKVDLENLEGMEKMGQVKRMMESARYKLMFKGDKSRIEVKSLLISMIMVNDFKLKKSLILTSALGDKSAQVIEGENYKSLNELNEDEEGKVEIGTGTKEIAGYSCKEAFISKADGTKSHVWFTPSLEVQNSPFNRFQSPLIKGLILEMESDFNGIKVQFTADKVSEKEIDDKYLGFGIPKGYELKDPDLSQLKSGL